jgi:hypothetical protein
LKNPVGATTIEKSQMNSDDNQASRNLGILLELPKFTRYLPFFSIIV